MVETPVDPELELMACGQISSALPHTAQLPTAFVALVEQYSFLGPSNLQFYTQPPQLTNMKIATILALATAAFAGETINNEVRTHPSDPHCAVLELVPAYVWWLML